MNPIELTRELVKIPSVSRQSTNIADYISKMVNGEKMEYLSYGKPMGENVVSISEPNPGKPFILLNGHLDTVAPVKNWETNPYIPVTKGDKLFGLGAHDMKAGMAIIMSLFNKFKDRQNLIFSAVGDEESDSLGANTLLNEKDSPVKNYLDRIKGCLVAEPTDEKVMLGARGRYVLHLKIYGEPGHGARPKKGANAVENASDVMKALRSMEMDTHEILGKGSYCILKIHGGTETLSIPEKCDIIVDRHYCGKMNFSELKNYFSKTIRGSNPGIKFDINLAEREIPYLKPYVRDHKEPFIKNFFSGIGYGKENIENEIIHGESVGDFNLFGNKIPTVVFGAKGGNHHAANEFVRISSLQSVYEKLNNWLINQL